MSFSFVKQIRVNYKWVNDNFKKALNYVINLKH